MDFAKLDTKSSAEKGAFLQLNHPVLGYPLWDGEGDEKKAVGVFVRGTESKTVQDRLKQAQKEQMRTGADTLGASFVASLVIGWQGIDRDGAPALATEENIQWFFDLSDSFVEQVVEFARSRSNFFGKPAAV